MLGNTPREVSMKRYLIWFALCVSWLMIHGQASDNVSLVDKLLQAYGSACDIEIRGNLALISGTEHVLISYDTSNPANPEYLDSFYLSDATYADPTGAYGNLLIYGNYVYFYVSPSRVEVFDVSDTGSISHLITLNSFADLSNRYMMQESRLYAIQGSDVFTIWDLLNPLAPVQLGSYTFSNWVMDFAINGDYAYVSNHGGVAVGYQISVLNISNPASPALLGSYSGFCQRLAYHNGYLYSTSGADTGLMVWNATDPAILTLVNTIFFPLSVYEADLLIDNGILVVRSDYPVIEDKGLGTFLRYELSSPATPESLPLLQTDQAYHGCWALGNNLIFNCSSYYQIAVYGQLNSQTPVQLGRISGMITSRSAIQGQSLLLNSGSIIDTADLEAVPKFFHNCAYLCADEAYVYTIASSYLYRWVLDTEGNPSLSGAFMIMPVEYSFCAPLNIVGDYIYAGGYFIKKDLSEMVQNNVLGNPNKIVYYGNYAIAAGNGLKICDISSPTNPQLLGTLFNNTQISDIEIHGSTLIIALIDAGLTFYDLSDPLHPTMIVSKPNALGIRALEINGNYLFTAGSQGLKIYSLYNIASPVPTGYYNPFGPSMNDIQVMGNRAFVCEGRHLSIYDVSEAVCNPDIPELPVQKLQITSYPNPFGARATISLKGHNPATPCIISVYNLKGQLIRILLDDKLDSGLELVWDGKDVCGKQTSPGMYLIKAEQDGRSSLTRIVKLK